MDQQEHENGKTCSLKDFGWVPKLANTSTSTKHVVDMMCFPPSQHLRYIVVHGLALYSVLLWDWVHLSQATVHQFVHPEIEYTFIRTLRHVARSADEKGNEPESKEVVLIVLKTVEGFFN